MDPLIQSIQENVINGQKAPVENLVRQALEAKLPPDEILNTGLIAAMKEVGARFEAGDFYVPEMLIAARAMQAGLAILKPHLVSGGVQSAGRVVIGTVKGDLHDIGKNLVCSMLEGAGFTVINLGNDVSPMKFVEAIEIHKPDLVGMSALLTTTMTAMDTTIKQITESGLRSKVKIIVGGAPLSESYSKRIGADGFSDNANGAVRLARLLVNH